MPLYPHVHSPIFQRVADRVSGDTRYGQVAHFTELFHCQTPEGEPYATVKVRVVPHALTGTALGDPLTGPGIRPYELTMTASNNTLVVMTGDEAGKQLAVRAPGTSDADWAATIASFPELTTLQGDFFEFLRDNAPIVIGDLIRQHILNADALGRFA